jgi:trehalose 6-phosphate synthase
MEGAVIVNPYDIEEVSAQIRGAIEMSLPEQTARMRRLRAAVLANDVTQWTESFLNALESAHTLHDSGPSSSGPAKAGRSNL